MANYFYSVIVEWDPLGVSCGNPTTSSSRDEWENGNRSFTLAANPNTDCGWRFVRWDIDISVEPTGPYIHQTRPNPAETISLTPGTYGGIGVVFRCKAVYEFHGTGKLMRSSVHQGKLIRVGNELLLDI